MSYEKPLSVITELNSELYDQHNEEEWSYWYRTNGFAEQIGFHDMVLWCSEANGTEYDPETDEEIPLIEVVRSSARRHAKKFNKLVGGTTDNTHILRSLTDKITELSRSIDLEEIGTPVCNCGGRADNIADALYAIIRELKEENNDEQ